MIEKDEYHFPSHLNTYVCQLPACRRVVAVNLFCKVLCTYENAVRSHIRVLISSSTLIGLTLTSATGLQSNQSDL